MNGKQSKRIRAAARKLTVVYANTWQQKVKVKAVIRSSDIQSTPRYTYSHVHGSFRSILKRMKADFHRTGVISV